MTDVTAAFFWMTSTAALGGSAFLLARRWFPKDGFAAMTVHVTTLSWTCIVGVTLLLGVQRLLTPELLMLCVVACVLWGVWYTYGLTAKQQPPIDKQRATYGFKPFALMWGIVASILAVRLAFHGLLKLPFDWDTLAYHLPLIDHWVRDGTLYAPDCAFGYVPGNNEILGLWAVAPFSGDFLIHLNNVLPAVLLAAASFELCQLLGLVQPIAHFCALGVVSTRPMFRQIVSAENDLAVAALFFAMLMYAIRFSRHQRMSDQWLAAATFGLLIGIKYYAVGYAGVAGVGLLGLLWAVRGGQAARNAFVIGLVGAVLLGSYWYFRNAWHYDAPLFPKGLVGSSDLWNEIRPDSHTSSLLYGGRFEVWTLLARAIFDQAGPVQLLAVLLFPMSTAWMVIASMKNRLGREAKAVRWMLAGVTPLAAFVYLVTPNVIETKLGTMNMLLSQYHPVRFGLSFFSISMIGMAVVTSDLVRWSQSKRVRLRWFGGIACGLLVGPWLVGAVWQFVRHTWHNTSLDELLLACNLCLVGIVIYICWTSRSSVQRGLVFLLAIAVIPLTAWGVEALSDRWHDSFDDRYEQRITSGSLGILADLDPNKERICVCDSRYYPFLGSRRQFDVCRPLWFRDAAEFLQYVVDKNVTIVVVRTSGADASGRYAPIKPWVLEQPHIFRAFDENRRYTMFRVNRDALIGRAQLMKGQPTA